VDISYMFNEKDLHLVPYPVQYAIPMFPSNIKKKCLKDLRDRCGKSKKINPPKNFDEWIKENFGPTLNNYFFKQYTQKVWTVKANQMNAAWVGSRVAKMPYKKLAELCAMNEKDLKVIDIDTKNKLITYEKEQYGKFKLSYDVLINTSPIDQLIKQTKLCRELDLKHNKVFVIGIGLIKPMNCIAERFTWLYFPENTVPFYRVTFLSRYGKMTPDDEKYWSILCECAYAINDNDVGSSYFHLFYLLI
ncbi:unnamed protein product, partial [Onchocerca ochengi]|uniref:SAM-dependent MTase TRM10-type domain-containing protein n=1 Tax=Onchocerca ochengi TaxID=42157 RepID=A0A182ESQ5_ONCOC